MRRLLALVIVLGGCVDVPEPDALIDGGLDDAGRDGPTVDARADVEPEDGGDPPDGMAPDGMALDDMALDDMALDGAAPPDIGAIDMQPDLAPADMGLPDLDVPDMQPDAAPPDNPCPGDDLHFPALGLCMRLVSLPGPDFEPLDTLMIALQDDTLMLLQASVATEVMGAFDSFTHTLTEGAGGWQRGPGLDIPRTDATLTFVPGHGPVAAGGFAAREALAQVEVWSPETRLWSLDATPIGARHRHAAAARGETLVVSGGEAGGTPQPTVRVWGPDDGQVDELIPDLPTGRTGHFMGAVGDGLIVVGGEDPGGISHDSRVWHPGDAVWLPTQGDELPLFGDGAAFDTTGDVAVFGGGDIVDPETGMASPTRRFFVWRRDSGWVEQAMTVDRKNHRFTLLDEDLLLVWGSNPSVELIRLDTGEAEAVAPAEVFGAQRRRHSAARLAGRAAAVMGGRIGQQRVAGGVRVTVYNADNPAAQP